MSVMLERATDVLTTSLAPSPHKDYIAMLSIGSEALRRAKATPGSGGSTTELIDQMRKLFAEES